MQTATHPPTTSKKYLIPLFMIVMVDVLALTIILPLLPFYSQKFGASALQVGLLVSSFAFFQLLSGPLLGSLSDRIGRRPVLIFSQIGTLIGFGILAGAQSLEMIFFARMLDGATAGNLSVAQAYIADVTPPEKRTQSFALIGIAFGLGFLVGPAFSGFLSQYNEHYPIYLAMFLSLLSIIGTVFLLPESQRHATHQERRKSIFQWGEYIKFFKNPKTALPLYLFLLFMLSFSLFFSGFPLFAQQRFTRADGQPYGIREVGYIYAFSGFLGIFIQGKLVGMLARKWGEQKLALFGFISSVLGYAVLATAYTLPVLILSAFVGAFGSGVLRPALTSLVSQNTDRNQQGSVLGLTQSLNSISTIVMPILGGYLFEHHYSTAWALSSFMICLVAMVTLARRDFVKENK